MMKRISIILGFVALAACGDTEPELTVQQQALEPVKITEFTPLQRTGCEKLKIDRKQPVSMYFEAIAAKPVKVELAKEAVARLHRQLYCMSAKDYATNYKVIMPHLEAMAKDYNYSSVVAPIVHIMSESGAKYLDSRTQRLMAKLTPSLLQELLNKKPVAHGIGLQFKRGLSAVEMNESQMNMLLSSTSTYSYIRSECSFNQAVFFEFGGGEGKVKRAYVCLNDDCPIFDDYLGAIDTSSAEAYARYCRQQKGKLDDLKGSGTASGGGSGGQGGASPSYVDTTNDLAKCASQYTSPGQFACFVESALGNRSIDSHTNVIQTKFDLETRPKGCGSPIAGNYTDLDKERDHIEKNKEQDKQLDDAYAQYLLYAMLCDDGEVNACDYVNEAIDTIRSVLKERSNDHNRSGQNVPVIITVDHNNQRQVDGTALDQYQQTYNKDLEQREKDLKVREDFFHSPCQVGGAGCSDTCDIQSQIDLYESTSNCMGFAAGQADLGDNAPQPDPTIMYPSPNQVHASAAFIGLANCVAGVTGAAPIGNAQPTGQHCGSTVLCTDTTQMVGDGPNTCSCKAQASLPAKFEKQGWEIVSACNSTIQCSPNATSCSCNGLLNVFNPPPQHGGLPADPSIMLMVNFD